MKHSIPLYKISLVLNQCQCNYAEQKPMQIFLLRVATNNLLREYLDIYIPLLKQYIPRSDVFLEFDPNYNLKVHSSRKFQRVYI